MIPQIRKLTAMGYSTAVKTWPEEEGFTVVVWKAGAGKDHIHTGKGLSHTEVLKALIRKIKESESQ